MADPAADLTRRARLRAVACLAALCAISLVSRLPQLLSGNLLVDGDEAVLGLMAKHLAQGKAFPIFFLGQRYGLSTAEAVAGAVSFLLFGTTAVALKLAMLALWTIGVLFVFLALATRVGRRRAFWIAVVLLLTPAWAVWSMKARGGYLTAFTASAMLVWLIARHRAPLTSGLSLAVGVLTSVVYLAQALWLPSVLPFIVLALLRDRRWSPWAISGGAAAAVIGLTRFVGTGPANGWAGPVLGNLAALHSIPGLAHAVYVNLTGAYYLALTVTPPEPLTTLLACVWCALLVIVALGQLIRLMTRQYEPTSHLLFASVCAAIASKWLLLSVPDARYLLPLDVPLVLLVGVELVDLRKRRLLPRWSATALVGAFVAVGSISLCEFRDFNFVWKNAPGGLTEAGRIDQVLAYVRNHGVSHVVSMNGLLAPQLVFYSDEHVRARWAGPGTRDTVSVEAVDRALDTGLPVAIVGYTKTSGAAGCDVPKGCTGGIDQIVPDPQSIITIDGKYFIYLAGSRDLVLKLGFRLVD